MSFGNLAKMAQQMQTQMARVQAELAELRLEGTAGGGAVRVVATGKQEIVSVTIDPAAIDPDDVDMLQDLIAAAVNDALRAAREVGEQKMAAVWPSSPTGLPLMVICLTERLCVCASKPFLAPAMACWPIKTIPS